MHVSQWLTHAMQQRQASGEEFTVILRLPFGMIHKASLGSAVHLAFMFALRHGWGLRGMTRRASTLAMSIVDEIAHPSVDCPQRDACAHKGQLYARFLPLCRQRVRENVTYGRKYTAFGTSVERCLTGGIPKCSFVGMSGTFILKTAPAILSTSV